MNKKILILITLVGTAGVACAADDGSQEKIFWQGVTRKEPINHLLRAIEKETEEGGRAAAELLAAGQKIPRDQGSHSLYILFRAMRLEEISFEFTDALAAHDPITLQERQKVFEWKIQQPWRHGLSGNGNPWYKREHELIPHSWQAKYSLQSVLLTNLNKVQGEQAELKK